MYCEIASYFNLHSVYRVSFGYIERFFNLVNETEKILQLSFILLTKIISSSSQHITSELEVFNAVEDWLSHNYNERFLHIVFM